MVGPLRWFAQVVSVALFNLRTLPQRIGSSATAMFGIAGVVAVMVGVLSIAQGILRTMEQSAAPENVVVLRSGSNSEMMSILLGDDVRYIAEAPGVARELLDGLDAFRRAPVAAASSAPLDEATLERLRELAADNPEIPDLSALEKQVLGGAECGANRGVGRPLAQILQEARHRRQRRVRSGGARAHDQPAARRGRWHRARAPHRRQRGGRCSSAPGSSGGR